MSEQEVRLKFERWYAGLDGKKSVERSSRSGQYLLMQTQISWLAYFAGYTTAKLEAV